MVLNSVIALNVGVQMNARVTLSRALIAVNDILIALTPTLIALKDLKNISNTTQLCWSCPPSATFLQNRRKY